MSDIYEQDYVKTSINEVITIKKIVTIHYFEFACDYIFTGEKHDFWEFLYVDKGEVEVMADTNGYKLEQGDIIFHKPGEFHSVWANGVIAPNIVVISFDCNSKSMKFFQNKIMKLKGLEKDLLGEIIKESREAFSNPLDYYAKLEKRTDSKFGCEQLIQLYLELLLINLVRTHTLVQNKVRLDVSAKERVETDIVARIIDYLRLHIDQQLCVDQICSEFSLGKTNLKNIFKSKTGMGVITYFKELKIETAKTLIRERKYNFTEIAEQLGYESIHCFSRAFKEATNMTPSEYALSVLSITKI